MTFRDDALAGRTAYITGGSSGICYGIAEHFVRHGARVAIQGRNAEKLAAVAIGAGQIGSRRILPVARRAPSLMIYQ
jgi:NAD(P)-dependent dehydrogenase (short-subunit alcohol dehydrogenase family)